MNSPPPDVGPNMYKPVPPVPPHLNGNVASVDDIRDQSVRSRPPGAQPPTIPGYNGQYDESSILDMYASDDPLRNRPLNQHHHQPSVQTRFTDAYAHANTRPYPDNSASLRAVQPKPLHSSSSDFISRRSSIRTFEQEC